MNLIVNSQNPIIASPQNDIPIYEEYTTGIISKEISKLSYVWVHVNETSFLSLMAFDEIYKAAPFYPFFGQSFSAQNESFFVGTVISGFELYEDSNGNGVLDLVEELKVFIALNGSTGYLIPQIEKTASATSRIYRWKVGYFYVDGFLFPDPGLMVNRKTIIDSVNLTYTFTVTGNFSELKLALEMGSWDAYEFTFNEQPPYQEIRLQDVNLANYSLSILFGTTVSSEKPITLRLKNGTVGMSDAVLKVNDVPIFESMFQDNYNLGMDGVSYPAYAVPAPKSTLFDEQLLMWRTPQELYTWWQSFFSSMSDLTVIPPLGIEEVSFLYRICYPVWGGASFTHDPRYRALFKGETPQLPTTTKTLLPASTTTPSTTERPDTTPPPSEQPIPIFLIPEVVLFLSVTQFYRKRRNK